VEAIVTLEIREATVALEIKEAILILDFREARAQSSLNLLVCQQDQVTAAVVAIVAIVAIVAVVVAAALVLDHALQVQVPAFIRDRVRSSMWEAIHMV
jgi:hypothetical protein